MKLSLQPLRLKTQTAAFVAVLLSLWLNVASLAHQMDFDPIHHEHHHCQLFSSIHHGLSHVMVEPPVWPTHYSSPSFVHPFSIALVQLAYLARSPPSFHLPR
ncbi:DUF2607 family protein [Vibrio cincinnatiensis]